MLILKSSPQLVFSKNTFLRILNFAPSSSTDCPYLKSPIFTSLLLNKAYVEFVIPLTKKTWLFLSKLTGVSEKIIFIGEFL